MGVVVGTKVRVHIEELVNDGPVERFLFGGWWWRVSTGEYPCSSRHGFARSEEKAKKKAEKAAKSLAPEPEQNYILEV